MSTIRQLAVHLTGCNIAQNQLCLSATHGGYGIMDLPTVAPAAYLASILTAKRVIRSLLNNSNEEIKNAVGDSGTFKQIEYSLKELSVPPLANLTPTSFFNASYQSVGMQRDLSLHLSIAAQKKYEAIVRKQTPSQKALHAGAAAPYAPIPITTCEFNGICALTNAQFHTYNMIRTGTTPFPQMHTCPLCNMDMGENNINHWLSCNSSKSGRSLVHHDIKRVLFQAARKANQGRAVNEPPHLLSDANTGSKLRPDFAIYGGIGDTLCGQAFDFSVVIPTAVSIVKATKSSIDQPKGTRGMMPPLQSIKVAEKRKNEHYRKAAEQIKFSFVPLIMEATGGMSETLRKFLRYWTMEHTTFGTSYSTRTLAKEVSYTLIRGQAKMFDRWIAAINAVNAGRVQRGSFAQGGVRPLWHTSQQQQQQQTAFSCSLSQQQYQQAPQVLSLA